MPMLSARVNPKLRGSLLKRTSGNSSERLAAPSREPLSTTITCRPASGAVSAFRERRSWSTRLNETITTEILFGSKSHLTQYNSMTRAGGGRQVAGLPFPGAMREHREGDRFLRIGMDVEFGGRRDAAAGKKSFELHEELCVVDTAARRDDFLRFGREAPNSGRDSCRGEDGRGRDEIQNGKPGGEERFDELAAVLLAARGFRRR